MTKATILSIVIILFAATFASKALLHPGFYTSHDGEHQLVRQYVFDQGLRDGQIPVRVSRQLYYGYGYPLFIFTYRLPFYIGEVFRLAVFSYADSIKAVFLLTYIASGLTMFWFAKRWGNLAGLVAAILYLWAPYRFSVMFVRAALGEHVAAVFVPLLFGSVSFGKKSKINVVLGAVAIAGLFLSHAMMAQIVLLMFIPWSIGSWLLSDNRKYFIWRWLGMAILGLGLAAYYLLPAVAYRGLTQKLDPLFFANHFVTLRQLIYSPWDYAFSMRGTENDGMSFQVGIAQWAAAVLTIGFLIYKSYRSHVSYETHVFLAALLITFVMSIFLMTEKSVFIWSWWKKYINIDIPWRFLLMTTFTSSALAAAGFQSLTFTKAKVRLLVAVFLIGLALYANRNHLRVNEYVDYADSRLAEHQGTSNSDDEYRPVWDDVGVTKLTRPEALIASGEGELKVIESKSNLISLAVNSTQDIKVDINTIYFPGWQIFLDGRKWRFDYRGTGGIMRFSVPVGYHMIEAKYQETGLMKFADGISLIALGWVLVKSLKLKV